MKPKVQEREPTYTGPVSVVVPMDQWRQWVDHSPAWWPRRFSEPTREQIRDVFEGLQNRIIG